MQSDISGCDLWEAAVLDTAVKQSHEPSESGSSQARSESGTHLVESALFQPICMLVLSVHIQLSNTRVFG